MRATQHIHLTCILADDRHIRTNLINDATSGAASVQLQSQINSDYNKTTVPLDFLSCQITHQWLCNLDLVSHINPLTLLQPCVEGKSARSYVNLHYALVQKTFSAFTQVIRSKGRMVPYIFLNFTESNHKAHSIFTKARGKKI